MAFSDIADSQALTGTTLDSDTLELLRNMADEAITERLEANLLTIPSGTIPYDIKEASRMWTCRNIKMREQADGSAPNVIRAGNYYQVTGVEKSIQMYDDKGEAALLRYLNGQKYTGLFERA